jgi:[ribosomal protein S5]-alanine N-acetyltransferase
MNATDSKHFSGAFYLSKHTRDDSPELIEALSDPRIANCLRLVPSPYTHSHLMDWFDKCEEELKDPETAPMRWCIRETSSKKLIGDLSLKPTEDGAFAIGYWLSPNYWGRGIMTEAVAAVLELGKEDVRVKRFSGSVKESNVGSRRVLEKNGFRSVGSHEESVYWTHRVLDFEREL